MLRFLRKAEEIIEGGARGKDGIRHRSERASDVTTKRQLECCLFLSWGY